MDGAYTMLLENGGRPGVFGMAGALSLAPPLSGWASKLTLIRLEDLQMNPQALKTMALNGRGTIDLTFYGFSQYQYYNYSFAAYMVSPTRMYWIETDNQSQFAGLVQGVGSGQLGGTYVYMGGALNAGSGTEAAILALLDATPGTGSAGTFDGIVDINVPTTGLGTIVRELGSSVGTGTYSADTLTLGAKWNATMSVGQNLTFYVNSGGQAVMLGEMGSSDNPILDGWMTLQ
jgi:hypothetical protein